MFKRRDLLIAASLAPISKFAFAKREFIEGKDYFVLPEEVPTKDGVIEVKEFFAYTCPHCLEFEPYIHEWSQHLPTKVQFEYSPVAWQKQLEPFVRAYYVLEAMGRQDLHLPFFESVVYQENPYDFNNPSKDIEAFMVSKGIDSKQWNKFFKSFSINNSTIRAEDAWKMFRVDSTPMIGVGGRYITGPHLVGDRSETIDCINFLVEKVRKEKNL